MDDYVEGAERNALPLEDLSELTIGSLLTRLQRAHIEKLLRAAEDPENVNAQVMAQINRFLADNGMLLNMPGQPVLDVTPGQLPKPVEPIALPNYEDRRYDE